MLRHYLLKKVSRKHSRFFSVVESIKDKTIIRLRNSNLTKVKLKNLKLNILPKLDLSEGYDFKICDLHIPIIEADPNNFYGGRVGDYYTMKNKSFAILM